MHTEKTSEAPCNVHAAHIETDWLRMLVLSDGVNENAKASSSGNGYGSMKN